MLEHFFVTLLVLTLVSGGSWVRFLRQKKIGKQIRTEGPQSHYGVKSTRNHDNNPLL